MDKTPKTLIYVAVAAIVLILALAAAAIWFVFMAESEKTAPELKEETALEVLKPELFAQCLASGIPGSYRSCKTDMSAEGDGWRVFVTFEGLYDDSVQASRVEAHIEYKDGLWVRSDISETSRCHEGRGHQDFSKELCA